MSLALLDWFILAVLTGGVVRGVVVGAVRQVTSLLGLVVAFLMAVQFMHPIGALVVTSLGLSETLGPLAGFVVVFLGVQFVFFGVSRLVEGLLDALSLTVLNRAAGGALGAFKAALLLSVLFLVLGDSDAQHGGSGELGALRASRSGTAPHPGRCVAVPVGGRPSGRGIPSIGVIGAGGTGPALGRGPVALCR